MISKTIFDYYEFLEKEDESYKGNWEIVDDGSEGLYCILFKLMGDKRSFETLCNSSLNWPAPSELHYSAESGDYKFVVQMMLDHECGMLENGATMEISSKIINDLEKCIPDFIDRVAIGSYVLDEEFLEQIWTKFYQ